MRSSVNEAGDQAHAEYSASRAKLISAVAEISSNETWVGDGACDLASWLCSRWQISGRTARELVKDAAALGEHPVLKEALASGEISIDQCKALTKLPGDDAVALENLPFWTISELEREARKQTASELERKDDGVYLRMTHTSDERYMRGDFRLHPEDGAALLSAIEARIPHHTNIRDWDHASALALVELAKGSAPARCQKPVVLSVKQCSDEVATLSTGGFVSSETARRLRCDGSEQVVHHDRRGKITGFERTSRYISAALRRVIETRDHGRCTYNECGRELYLECHHIVHVEDGGATTLDNLILVCLEHHKMLHEGGWSVEGQAGPNMTWIKPDGAPFEPRIRVSLDTS